MKNHILPASLRTSPSVATNIMAKHNRFYATLLSFVLALFLAQSVNAQIPVTVTGNTNTTPNLAVSYASLAAALTDLNLVTAMTGPVTLTLGAGSSETAPTIGLTIGSATLNPVLSSTNTITIIKASGTVTLNAGVGAFASPSATPDCIMKLTGADYVTIDGLTFTDGNSASATVAMEVGLGLFKLNAGDGCNNNTIQNCTFNMQRISNGSGTTPMLDGSWAIEVVNSTATAATTALTPTNGGTLATNGTNSGNKFYANSINNGNGGIGFGGYPATLGVGPAPTATTFLGDLGNDVGGSALATGNSISNFGGGAITSPSAGIRANNQWGVNISYNTINNNNGSGVNHGTTLRGIYGQAGTSANATINNNTVTVNSAAVSSACTAIENAIGSTAAGNTVNVINSIITGCTYTTATTGTFSGILNSCSAATVNMSGNTVTGTVMGTSGVASSCTFQGIYMSGSCTTLNMNTNTVTSNTINNQGGAMYCTRASTSLITYNGNIINNNTIPLSGGTLTCSIYGYYNLASATVENLTNNNIDNLSISGSSTSVTSIIYGIYSFTVSTDALTYSGNMINTLTYSNSSTGACIINGLRNSSGGTVTYSKNKIYGLTSNGASASAFGIYIGSGAAVTVSNNLIGNITTPSANAAIPLAGINVAGGTAVNLYYNTVYLNGASTGALFGSAALYASTSPTLDSRNNIFVNLSTPVGATGFTAAYRRTTTTLTSYASTSNNNLYYAGTPGAANLIFYDGTTGDQTLADFKTRVTPRDAASVTENPPFSSTTGSSSSFLHINPAIATQIESGGTPIGSITTDYDGDTRNASFPDIGADEGTFTSAGDITGPSISYTPLASSCSTSPVTLTASITDFSGIPTAGIGLPRVYWKINAGSYTGTAGTYVSGSNYSFTFGSGVSTGDVVSYYVAAQDNAGTPNVSVSPSTGASGFSANPPAVSTPPTTPNTYTILATLSGSYNVGTAGAYPTLTAAVADYNIKCIGGPVVFNLTDATYSGSETFPITINANSGSSSTNTLTIKPAAGIAAAISGSPANALIKLFGADYVIIDGLNSGGSSLSLSNTNATSSGIGIWIGSESASNGATNNIIRNCTISGNSGTTTVAGIIGSSGTTAGSAAETANSNNTIQACTISKCQNGLFMIGNATTLDQNWLITQNVIGSTVLADKGFRGIAVQHAQNFTISDNLITGVLSTTSSTSSGILVGAVLNTGTISRNKIADIKNTYSVGYGSNGIYLNSSSTTANVTVSNNFISDVASYGYASGAAVTDNGYGIIAAAGAGYYIYYNSVNMNTSQTVSGLPAAFNVTSGVTLAGAIDVRNNIFNSTESVGTERYSIYSGAANTVFSFIDNNDYYTTGPNLGFIGSNRANLAAIQAGFGSNTNSQSGLPTFISPTNLHLLTPDANNFNYLESKGVAIGITTDIDNESRPNGSAPDIGADEFVGAAPSCNVPTAVVVGSITTTSASVSFTCGSCTGTYIVEYGLTGFTPGTGATPGAGGTVVSGASSPIGLSSLTPGTTYQVYVRQDCGAGSYSTNSTVVSFTTRPLNDECAGAVSLSVSSGASCTTLLTGQSTAGATQSQAACLGTADDDVWFSFVATSTSHIITLSTISGSTDMVFQVFSGTCGSLVSLLCSDPNTGAVGGLTPTITYYVRVHTYGTGNSATFDICITTPPPPPANDDPCGAFDLGTPAGTCTYTTYTNANATSTSGPPAPGCANYLGGDVWFKVTVPASGILIFDSQTGVITDSGMAIYSSSDNTCTGTFTLIECDDDDSANGLMSYINRTGLTPGSVIFVRFWEYGNDNNGTFGLCVTTVGCAAPPQPTMSGITSTTATATWAGAGSFILEYGPTGYTPGTAGAAGATGTLIDPAVSPQAISGLSPSSVYDLYVRQVCSGPIWSVNSPVRTFTTLAPPPANDDAPGALTLTVGAVCSGNSYTNVAATLSASEPYPSCSGTAVTPVWFKFVAPASGAVRVSTDISPLGTFTDSKMAIYSAGDPTNYATFSVISCDDDGGFNGSGFMSVAYATGLTPGTTYYIVVDRWDSFVTSGTFCIQVDELNSSMLSTTNTCASSYQSPESNSVATYTGWCPLLDASSKLIALVRNPAGGDVSLYSPAQNINTGPVRSYGPVKYLDRNFLINNSTATTVDVQFFYLNSELTALMAADPLVTASNLGTTEQTGTTCANNFADPNGVETFLPQTGNGVSTDGLVRWIQVTTPSFSNFYMQGSTSAPLPVSLISFNGYKEGSHNLLKWTSSNESNNRGYEVQRSSDGVNFTAIGFVDTKAPGGTSISNLNYTFTDMSPTGNRQYYRLRQIDNDDHSKLSIIVMIKSDKPLTLSIDGLFPNPASTQINLLVAAPVRDDVTVVVMDATGRIVMQQVVSVEAGSNTIPVDIDKLSNGSYMLKLICAVNCETVMGRFVKQ